MEWLWAHVSATLGSLRRFCRKCSEVCGLGSAERSPLSAGGPTECSSVSSTPGEDYLLRKLPTGGQPVRFALPRLMPSLVQPKALETAGGADEASKAFSRELFTQRKSTLSAGERSAAGSPERRSLAGSADAAAAPPRHYPEPVPNGGHVPVTRAHTLDSSRSASPFTLYGSEWDLRSASLGRLHGHVDSEVSNAAGAHHVMPGGSSVYSSLSSIPSSISVCSDHCSNSDSPSLDETEGGHLNVRIRYEPSMQQLWVTIVKAVDLEAQTRSGDGPSAYVKGVLNADKTWPLKTTTQRHTCAPEFNETFVFVVAEPAMATANLQLSVLSRWPHRAMLGGTTLALEQAGPQEQDLWLPLSEQELGQYERGQLFVATSLKLSTMAITIQVIEARKLKRSTGAHPANAFVKADMWVSAERTERRRTRVARASKGDASWVETLSFPATNRENKFLGVSVAVRVCHRDSLRRTHVLGQVMLGWEGEGSAQEHWRQTLTNPDKVIAMWHQLK
ncbi:tandem C2 domains nuclear protein-like [Lethenteron reissneri]|uniref:tandem C2 domains nuclear protein-like n=1 Tax=Lethenteron reissneri TaxID=7753 RepID=UPI002AB6CF0C|nr:tandem C2 domains nuclear protein-like [Lethenteron reissneri]